MLPLNCLIVSSEGLASSQGFPVNLCPVLTMSSWFLISWFLPRQGCKFTVNGNWRWCYLGIEWDPFSICSLCPPEDKGWLGGGKNGGELPESWSAVIYGYWHGLEAWVRAGPQPAKVSLTNRSFLRDGFLVFAPMYTTSRILNKQWFEYFSLFPLQWTCQGCIGGHLLEEISRTWCGR